MTGDAKSSRCAICGASVILVPGDRRRGPEGLSRCSDHVGEPIDEDEFDLDPEPKSGTDYDRAQKREITVHYDVKVRVRVSAFKRTGAPLPGEEGIEEQARRLLCEGELADVHEVYRDRRWVGGTWKVTEDGEEFDEDAWRQQKIAEDHGAHFLPDGPRPEDSLEAFM